MRTAPETTATDDAGRAAPRLAHLAHHDPLTGLPFAADLAASVARHEIDPRRFILELTETAWSLEAGRTMPVLQELTTAGFTLALDDFGAGYSSLSRLRRLPVKVIKIDRAFVTDLPEDPQAVAIVEAILAVVTALLAQELVADRRTGG